MNRARRTWIAALAILAVVGIGEVFEHLPTLWRAMGTLKKALRTRRPDALVLVDYPDFNFRLARMPIGHNRYLVPAFGKRRAQALDMALNPAQNGRIKLGEHEDVHRFLHEED